ncbi:redox-regulated ATPase YchF [Lentimicrobium sp.]|uniref:redox-regulated ATPase YchF n=1 Tax=Lentimicrobium sp. TaxID=2034841 RepID=UPI0025E6816F|nr:redox-regulated ATPase YchF [Lentimicrobium sp.]MCO5257400.1 redox-regulated ATPase YchF [Lentimicrobium sp.]MCO5262682.1 redox-regulated ATPase YchF [Lentimicrobium sp.]HOP12935.1 redox-regulated ATPase YchF [Lentimicrobium sp.]HPF63545.1 redox-regulated ATPase YchF [Lentimicrobium sp.]HPJ62458.1 redox-regulated ATPase YchF [Lentimicrobium sp.]
MALKCGIVGLTNIGKTTLFNCISNTKGQTSNFAYSTNKSNLGQIIVPDDRLYEIDKLIKSARVVPVTVEIVDIPGLAKGASQGEGVGNKFLADIQQTDAIIHVLRCFDDENLPHVEGSVNPVRDREIVDLELQIRDLDLVERKIQRLEKIAKSGDKDAKHGIDVLTGVKEHLEGFQSVRSLAIDETNRRFIDDMYLLTDKPVIYVCNVDDASAVNGNKYVDQVKEAVKNEDTQVLVIAGALEAEIAELESAEDRGIFLEDAGLSEPGVNKLVRSAYDILNLMSFFTAGPKEVRAWTIKKGMTAPQAAGVIHSDLERGFIRAEVMKYKDFIELKSEHACREAGKLYVEGKNYIVEDGDIMHIRFNV